MASNIRKGDLVEIVAGNDRGKRASVMEVMPGKGQLLIEGVGQVYKHLRRDRKNPQGGRLQKEAPVDVSNVMLVCTKCDARTRVGFRRKSDGAKVRVCRKCDAELG